MKNLFLLLVAIFFTIPSLSQNHKGICKIEVSDVSAVTTFGYLNYTVEFFNKSNQSVDGIYWTATYYNNAGELIKREESAFNSGGLIDPIASGFKKTVARVPNVKGASKILIVVNKVHFVLEGNCP